MPSRCTRQRGAPANPRCSYKASSWATNDDAAVAGLRTVSLTLTMPGVIRPPANGVTRLFVTGHLFAAGELRNTMVAQEFTRLLRI